MAHGNNLIKIPGELTSVASEGVVAAADAIKDYTKGKFQEQVNADVDTEISKIKGGSDASIASLEESIENEVSRAQQAEQNNSDAIEAEKTRAEGVEATKANADDVYSRAQGTAFENQVNGAISEQNTNIANKFSQQDQLIDERLDAQDDKIDALEKQEVVIVDDHEAVENPDPKTIYREVSEDGSSYTDWMYQGEWKKLATYSFPGIDDEPIPDSDNIAKSGGITNMYGSYTENPEFAYVQTDNEDKILFGVKQDGSMYFGEGCPTQVKNYIDEKLAELSLDEYEDIVAFLSDYLGSDTTLKVMIDSINERIPEIIGNSEFIEVTTDSEDKVLEGIQADGTKVIGGDLNVGASASINGDIRVLGNMELSGVSYKVIENPEWLQVTIDSEEKILEGLTAEGKKKVMVETSFDTIELSENGIEKLVNDLEEAGISGGITQEELEQQLTNYATISSLASYETKQALNQTLEGYVKTTDDVSHIANNAVTVPSLSQAVKDLISAGGGGTITNNPDDITIGTNGNNQLEIKVPYRIRGAQGPGGNLNDVSPVYGATDFQLYRDSPEQTALSYYSFIAGGQNNAIHDIPERAKLARHSHVEGFQNLVVDWRGHAEGGSCLVDGKIAHAQNNATISSANDGHAEGNLTMTGRRYFDNLTHGSEDAGDGLGVLDFVVIDDSWGDVTSFFPNLLTDNLDARYGAPCQMDIKGNIYPRGFTPATYDGEGNLVDWNHLTWAFHPVCVLRGPGEGDWTYASIRKATYTTGVGTKVYFVPDTAYSSYNGIGSSYCPVSDLGMGNSSHAEGWITNASGYGGHSEGYMTWALAHASHSEGRFTKALGECSHAGGEGSVALRYGQRSYALLSNREDWGKRQSCEIIYDATYQDWGWHTIPLIKTPEPGKTYCIEATVIGKQTAGSAGTIGDTFAYKVMALVNVESSSNCTFLGTPKVELIGRSSGMDGDGITSGVRLSAYTSLYAGNIIARLDSINNTTFRVMSSVKWVEMMI